MGTPYTFDEGLSSHLTRIGLFYIDDNFCHIAQRVPPLCLTEWAPRSTAMKPKLSKNSLLYTPKTRGLILKNTS